MENLVPAQERNIVQEGNKKSVILRFALVYATVSLVFSLLSWGQVPRSEAVFLHPWTLVTGGLTIHMATHAIFGALAGLPSRDGRIIAAGVIAVVVIDFDHVGAFTGLPFAGRTGHSPAFLFLATVVVRQLAKAGFFRVSLQPIQMAAITAASVPAHMAVDAMSHGGPMPVLAPISFTGIFIPSWTVWLLQGAALLAVWASGAWVSKQRRPSPDPLKSVRAGPDP